MKLSGACRGVQKAGEWRLLSLPSDMLQTGRNENKQRVRCTEPVLQLFGEDERLLNLRQGSPSPRPCTSIQAELHRPSWESSSNMTTTAVTKPCAGGKT